MKFTCESCSAQYMISDEKVGPSGVKVRCKKCGNVILVRRGAPAPAEAPAPAPEAAAPQPSASPGLEAELGQAFDHAFGAAAPAAEPAPPAPAAAAGPDLGSTQLMGSDDAAKVFADKPAVSAVTEWYVAIGQAQVGPLPLGEVKRKWEAGDVGPDSLVWRPGMSDWAPLTTVSDLAGYLAPVPRSSAKAAEPRMQRANGAEAAPAPAPAEASWKPMGASALAALASEEIAARAPEARPGARPAEGGVKSLVDGLPDGGGVDPTGALPLNIKALEATTTERKLERRSSLARGAAETRRRSTARAVVIGVAIGAAVVAGAAVGGVALYHRMTPPPAPPVAAARPPAPSPGPAAAAATPAVAQAPAPGAPAETSPAQPTAAATPPPAQAPAPPAAAAAPPAEPAAKEPPPARAERHAASGKRGTKASAKLARAEPLPKKEPPRVASTEETPAPPPAPARKSGGLLDFESNDKALDDALGQKSGASSRSVYVPPARANASSAGGALPEKVSPGEINGAVAARIDALRRCVSEQKTREPDASGTLKMRWIIQGDGSAQDVKCLTPQYAQGAFAQCIAGVVKGIKFPRSGTAGQEVTFPFNF